MSLHSAIRRLTPEQLEQLASSMLDARCWHCDGKWPQLPRRVRHGQKETPWRYAEDVRAAGEIHTEAN